MVRDHLSENSYRDYAFIEYFSIKESTNALEQMKEKPLYIRGDIIYAAYSKIKREDYSNIPVNQQVYSYFVIFKFIGSDKHLYSDNRRKRKTE